MTSQFHIVVVPVPAQGHVAPLIQLSHILAQQGFRITFINSHFNHNKFLASDGDDGDGTGDSDVHFVSVSDGLESDEERNDLDKLASTLYTTMPANISRLLCKMMEDGSKVDCVVADLNFTSVIKVAQELGIPTAGFWPASASTLLASANLQNLIRDGVIDDENGGLINQDGNQHSAVTSAMDSRNFFWTCMGDRCAQKNCFEAARRISETIDTLDWVICNSAYDLEPKAFTLARDIKPIGPLSIITNQINHPQKVLANVWPEDATCLKWLDQQPSKSVIFVAFGSLTTLAEEQFKELALGLELLNKPFLWVVRPNITVETQLDSYLQGFKNQIAYRGQLVSWAPQQKVLSHDAVACFLSHCGWNSTLEGLSNGVPFLCWPYFADQFANESYICDSWKTGLRLEKDRNGIITREEIKQKVEILLCDDGLKDRAQLLKKVAQYRVTQGGLSGENLRAFTKWLKHM